jgi:hypothetical protein
MSEKITHPELVRRLFKDPTTIEWTPFKTNLIHAAVGLAGEAGEVLDLLVDANVVTLSQPDYHRRILRELGDCLFYMEALDQTLGVTTVPSNLQVSVPVGDTEFLKLRTQHFAVAATQVLDLVKKQVFNNREGLAGPTISALELCAQVHDEICTALGYMRHSAAQDNIEKLSARYEGLSYSDEAAAARKDES